MVINIMNVDKMVKVNNLAPVTSPLYMTENKQPDPNGLFSFQIFGYPGSRERRMRPAYIDLEDHYLVPQVYKTLISLNRSYAELITGEKMFIFDQKTKELRKLPDDADIPGMGTGLDYLYEYWGQIRFRDSESKKRNDKVEMLMSLSKDEAFMTKQFVIPAFLRDYNPNSRVPEINGMYKSIIMSVDTLRSIGKIGFSYNMTRSRLQMKIVEIYDYFMKLIKLKTGFLHQSLMSKNIDMGLRTTITAPSYMANSWKELPADFQHAAIPLTQCISTFTLFIQAYVTSWFNSMVGNATNLVTYDQVTGKIDRKELHKNWKEEYSPEKLVKIMELYIHTPESRFHPVCIKFADGKHYPFFFIADNKDITLDSGKINKDVLKTVRYFTWTDLFYIAAEDVCRDKHVQITRYPITGPHSEYFAGVNVRTTYTTQEMLIGNKLYEHYPKIDLSLPSNKIEEQFVDTLEIFSPYMGPMGADHDGDQTTNRGIWTLEGNRAAQKQINSVGNLISPDGKTARNLGDSAQHVMLNLLRDPDD